MKILLLSPSEDRFLNFSKSKRAICVALPLLAAYTPREHEVIIAEQCYGDNVYRDDVDLVGISAMTSQAKQGYKVAEYYRERGIKVVMGGIHASVLPDEASQHVDAICVGEGDSLWKQILEDAAANRLQKVYKANDFFPMEDIPPLRLDLVSRIKTSLNHKVIQASRGCPYDCEFCTTAALFGKKYRFRPVDNVIEEIKMSGGKLMFFVDDNIFASPAYCEELFTKLARLKIRWFSQASLNSTTRDLKLLKLAKKSGLAGLFVGIESVNQLSGKISSASGKLGALTLHDVSKRIKIMLDHGLLFHSSIVFGLDGDDPTVFEKTVSFLKANNASISSFCILTPYPGTRIYKRFKEEGRIIHEDWSKYSNENVAFMPKLMTPEQLKNGSDWAGREFYKWRSIAKRSLANLHNPVVYSVINAFTKKANWSNHGPGWIAPMSKPDKKTWIQSFTS